MFKLKHYVSFVIVLMLVLSMGTSAFAMDEKVIVSYIEELLNNGDLYIISETGSVGSNNGMVKENNGSIVNNNQTVVINNGSIGNNNREVQTNKGSIESNNDTVFNNKGSIESNNDTVVTNEGSIVNNNKDVVTNNGTITTNSSQGMVESNYNLIEANYGNVQANFTGIIYNMGGHVLFNDDIVYNLGGLVSINDGTVYNLGGLVEFYHRGTVYEYYPVTFSGDTDKLSIDEISEDHPVLLTDPDGNTWVKGNDENIALRLSAEGCTITLSDSCDFTANEDGSIIVSNVRDALTVTVTIIPPPPAVANPYCVPATADSSNMPLWSALFIAFAALALLTKKKKA